MRRFPKLEYQEFKVFKNLKKPAVVQDFLDATPINFERHGDTCWSPLMALRRRKLHCMEGAMFAAAAFWYHGRPPLLLDLKTIKKDESHVLALFKEGNRWGAVSKTNHAVLRYRDPIFKSIRELAVSYFNEYYLDNGKKTLRSYSEPFQLLTYGNEWLTSKDHQWKLVRALDRSPHIPILEKGDISRLRPVDKIEVKAGKLTDWKRVQKKS